MLLLCRAGTVQGQEHDEEQEQRIPLDSTGSPRARPVKSVVSPRDAIPPLTLLRNRFEPRIEKRSLINLVHTRQVRDALLINLFGHKIIR